MHQRRAVHSWLHCGCRALSDPDVVRHLGAQQGHGNYAEYAPIGVILSGLAELSGRAPAALVHAFGAAMLLGRMGYGYAASVPIDEMSRNRDRVYSRIWGTHFVWSEVRKPAGRCMFDAAGSLLSQLSSKTVNRQTQLAPLVCEPDVCSLLFQACA